MNSARAVVGALGRNLFVNTTNSTLSQYIMVNLKNGRIRPSKSPTGALIYPLLPEKDGRHPLCVDFPGLNAQGLQKGQRKIHNGKLCLLLM